MVRLGIGIPDNLQRELCRDYGVRAEARAMTIACSVSGSGAVAGRRYRRRCLELKVKWPQ